MRKKMRLKKIKKKLQNKTFYTNWIKKRESAVNDNSVYTKEMYKCWEIVSQQRNT